MEKYSISRFINGITLNPKEYILDDDGEVRLFSKSEALELMDYGTIEDAWDDGIYIELEKEMEAV